MHKLKIPQKGKFSRPVIFAVFHGWLCTTKIKNHEIFLKFVESNIENPEAHKDTLFSNFPFSKDITQS